MGDILVRSMRDPLFGFTRDGVIDFLRRSLRGRCVSAYVFGSFARDDMSQESDIDCIVVTGTELPFPERPVLFGDLRDLLPSLEILVYTPEEFAELTEDPSPGFWRSVCRDLLRIG